MDLFIYRQFKFEAAVNWVLVKVNKGLGLKVVKKREHRVAAN
jgi:hypothetical protein